MTILILIFSLFFVRPPDDFPSLPPPPKSYCERMRDEALEALRNADRLTPEEIFFFERQIRDEYIRCVLDRVLVPGRDYTPTFVAP